MLSDIVAGGILKDNLKNGFRNLYIEHHDALRRKNVPSIIPILYWTRNEENRINRMKSETEVVIKGHLERDDIYGIYILVESIHFTK